MKRTAGALEGLALVTGVNSGIGSAIATSLLERGVSVCGLGRSEPRGDLVKHKLAGKFTFHTVDLRSPDEIDAAMKLVQESCSTVDFLMNVAGVWHDDSRAYWGVPLVDIPEQEIFDMFDVGLRGALLVTRRALQIMKRQMRGKVLFVSCGFSGPAEAPGWVHYYTINKSIEALSQAIAAEQRPNNIQVNCLAPWYVATEALVKFFPEKVATALAPLDVADAAIAIISRQFDNTSGQVIELRSNRDY
jgi:3-oxoacyl-[acyl-carrier protein] reductase